jgi:ribosomal protein S18 acetylase RimI-like enzyme
MGEAATLNIRPVDETDIGDVVAIDEKIGGQYRPDTWEARILYYLRRDPDASLVAECNGKIVGFMLGEVRSGEFGLDEPTGWIEVLGVDPDFRHQAVGRRLADAMLTHFRGKGAVCVRTLVDENVPSIGQFFTSLGFTPAPLQPFMKRL